MGFLRVTVFLISLTYHGKSEKIRCYCNLEECLSHNFLCSHEDGGCFSDFLDYHDIAQAKHGCLHLLERERQEQCGSTPGSPSQSPKSLLLCCKTDLCNQILGPTSLFTHSIIGSLINGTEGQNNLIKFEENGNYDNRKYNTNEVWFKAATIAVPICGAMILLLLVALAFKILRADHVTPKKYCGKTKSDANYTESHIIGFKTSELNSKDFSKKIPLLYEARQNELQNSENFRKYTSARIHFGQNVNSLKSEKDSSKVEKNLENEKINLGKLRTRQRNGPNTLSVQSEETNNSVSVEDNSNSILDVRVEENEAGVLPTLCLNLDKPENLNSCNLYINIRTGEQSSLSVIDLDKILCRCCPGQYPTNHPCSADRPNCKRKHWMFRKEWAHYVKIVAEVKNLLKD